MSAELERALDEIPAISCHRKCYDLLKNSLDYELKFGDVKNELDEKIGVFKDHYFYQDLPHNSFEQEFIIDENFTDMWLLEDPFLNEKNKNRIIEIWSKRLKVKK